MRLREAEKRLQEAVHEYREYLAKPGPVVKGVGHLRLMSVACAAMDLVDCWKRRDRRKR